MAKGPACMALYVKDTEELTPEVLSCIENDIHVYRPT